MLVLTREQCRQIDRRAIDEYGLPGIVLMENAGRGTAEKLLSLGARGPVVIACGKGNNGGDGLVIARHLDLRGIPVRVLLWADPARMTGDVGINMRVHQRAGLPLTVFDGSGNRADDDARLEFELAGADWIVDALLGTGARGEPRPPLDTAIDRLNAAGRRILAVDLPSGLDCDTGAATSHAIRAAHTCTFVAQKPGFLAVGAASYTGQIHVIDIGVPRRLIEEVVAAT
jgi:NAD(P)H-hydrate epimerase